ncbi:hypothetical protein [Pedobacter sp.]|uniref:hypothetical protein n=1 Tax=Pedobacter sp. TaxID=1411316 RepID=UPI003D7F8055
MKNLFVLLFVFSLVYVGCKKTEQGPVELYGKWKLNEILADPGDGSGKYRKVTGEPKYLMINRSGKMSGDAINLKQFKVLDSVRMEVINTDYKEPVVYYYEVSESSLTLNPPCIEGCGYRFVRE